MDWLVCFLVVLLPLQGESQPDDDLRIRVTAYWNSLQQGDKAAALNWVLPESRNAFIKRQEGEIRGWRLVSIEWSGHDEARVKVEVESFFPSLKSHHWRPVIETWVISQGTWRVRVRPVTAADLQLPFRSQPKPRAQPLSGRLRVVPAFLKIHFLNARRTGMVRIKNGIS